MALDMRAYDAPLQDHHRHLLESTLSPTTHWAARSMQHADFNQPPPSSLTSHASGTLKDNFLFALTSEAELQLVIQSMRCCDVAEGDVLVEQGHQGICTMH